MFHWPTFGGVGKTHSGRRRSGLLTRAIGVATVTLLTVTVVPPASADDDNGPRKGTKLQILDINDFHGHVADAGKPLAKTVEDQRTQQKNTALVSSGDNIGASPYTSSSQKDKPTLDALNALHLDASSVGNHEFDHGINDVQGRINGDTDFDYLGANVYKKHTKKPALKPYTTIHAGDLSVAVIGVVTRETKSLGRVS